MAGDLTYTIWRFLEVEGDKIFPKSIINEEKQIEIHIVTNFAQMPQEVIGVVVRIDAEPCPQ